MIGTVNRFLLCYLFVATCPTAHADESAELRAHYRANSGVMIEQAVAAIRRLVRQPANPLSLQGIDML